MRTPVIPAPRRPGMFCAPGTLDDCARCGQPMHRGKHATRTCEYDHPVHKGRRLCGPCYETAENTGDLTDYPKATFSRDELLEEWRTLALRGVTFWTFGPAIGMTQASWQRAYERARAAGHPLARRIDKET